MFQKQKSIKTQSTQSTFITRQTFIMQLHSTFNICRLWLVTNKNRKNKLEFILKKCVNARDFLPVMSNKLTIIS